MNSNQLSITSFLKKKDTSGPTPEKVESFFERKVLEAVTTPEEDDCDVELLCEQYKEKLKVAEQIETF